MSSDRYVPRTFTPDADNFGRARQLEWDYDDDERDQAEASLLQHRWAYVIRQAIKARYGTIRHYSNTNDVDYFRITAVLRGSAVMRLEDIVSAQRNLGVELPDDWLD